MVLPLGNAATFARRRRTTTATVRISYGPGQAATPVAANPRPWIEGVPGALSGRRGPAPGSTAGCATIGRRSPRCPASGGGSVASGEQQTSGGLRRELRFWEAIALSIAIMAPTAAMALNGTLPAQLIGRAVPLAFIFAMVGVVFVSYAFSGCRSTTATRVRCTRSRARRSGRAPASSPGGRSSAPTSRSPPRRPRRSGCSARPSSPAPGIWDDADWLLIALVAGAGIAFLAFGDIRVATRSLSASRASR